MSKQKSKSRTQTWHFVTTLPVDECVRRLQSWDNPNISATVATPENAPATFSIDYQQRFKQTMYATGTLQRWEGTHTRVDMQLTLGTNVNSILFRAPATLLTIAIGIILFLCQFFINSSVQFDRDFRVSGINPYTHSPLLVGAVLCVVGVVIVWAFILWMATPEEVGRSDLSKLRTLLRDHLCEGESSSLQYLVREGQVENLHSEK